MTTFAKKAFNAATYSAFRPTYPRQLFKDIFDYHRGGTASWEVAADLGCGTGQATSELKGHFSSIIGIDPSVSMIETARSEHKDPAFTFRRGGSDDLSSVLGEETVDLLISGQAGHWFDWDRAWPEIAKVLRKNGTAAIWIYSEMRLSNYQTTAPLITAYAQGKNPETSLGPYFERPGRTVLEDLLTAVPDPTLMASVKEIRGGFSHFQRSYFAGPHYPDHLPRPSPNQVKDVEMKKTMRWRDLLGYFRTWSSLQNYHERFPEDLHQVDDRFPEDRAAASLQLGQSDVDVSGGDIAIRFWKDLREEVKKQGGHYGVDDSISVEWPIALLLARKT